MIWLNGIGFAFCTFLGFYRFIKVVFIVIRQVVDEISVINFRVVVAEVVLVCFPSINNTLVNLIYCYYIVESSIVLTTRMSRCFQSIYHSETILVFFILEFLERKLS